MNETVRVVQERMMEGISEKAKWNKVVSALTILNVTEDVFDVMIEYGLLLGITVFSGKVTQYHPYLCFLISSRQSGSTNMDELTLHSTCTDCNA